MVFLEYKKKIKRIIEIIDYIIIYIYIYIYSQSCKGKHDYFLEEYGMVNSGGIDILIARIVK